MTIDKPNFEITVLVYLYSQIWLDSNKYNINQMN